MIDDLALKEEIQVLEGKLYWSKIVDNCYENWKEEVWNEYMNR